MAAQNCCFNIGAQLMYRVGYIYYNDLFVGLLKDSEFGFQFTYDASYVSIGVLISFNFPFDTLFYNSVDFFPYLENLISEGW